MISNKPFLKVLFLLSIIIVAFIVASYFPDLILTIIISILVSLLLKPLVVFLEYRFGIRRSLSIAIVFLFVGGLIAFFVIELVPIAIDKVKTMYVSFQTFPFEKKLAEVTHGIIASVPFIDATTMDQKVHTMIQSGLEQIGNIAQTAAGFLVNLLIIPFITYFILAESDSAIKKGVEHIPNKYFEMTLNVINKLQKELSSYLSGLMLESSIVGILTIIGLMILGVPYAIVIGIIAGIVNIIPYLGVIIAAGLALLVSLVQFGGFALLVPIAILTLIIRLIDDLILQPLCFGKSLDMHPVAVVITLLVGHQIMGVSGMVISIPIATILRVCAIETYWGLKHYSITA